MNTAPVNRGGHARKAASAPPAFLADIPADIWEAAKAVFADIVNEGGNGDDRELIARAIMAERERCAEIAPTLARVGFALNASEHGFADLVAKVTRSGEAV